MSVKERLKEYLQYKNISMRQFTITIGVSSSYVNNINKSIQPDKIDSITNYYPDLNTGWLLTGEGEMLKSEKKPNIPLINTETVPMSVLQFIMNSSKTASEQMGELIRQNGVLVDTIQKQTEIIDKATKNPLTDAHPVDDAECAAASGSDLED